MLSDIQQKLISIACLRVLSIQNIFKVLWSETEDSWLKHAEELQENSEGLKMMASSIGIDIDKKDIYRGIGKSNIQTPISIYIESCLFKDRMTNKIKEVYSENSSFVFTVSQLSNLIRTISSALKSFDLRKAPSDRKAFLKEERENGVVFIKETANYYRDNRDSIIRLFGQEFFGKIDCLQKTINQAGASLKWAEKVYNASEDVTNDLFPNYGKISDNIEQSKKLIKELNNCRPGVKAWREYESICLKILYYLFVPPFKRVIVQARSEGNNERRDAVLPNNQYTGFWNLINREFDSRHIICEFKNSAKPLTKSAINQLRIYLSKPTIGRFGILFTRKPPSKALLQARRDAYDQSNILILILDDEKLISFLKSKSYLMNADDFLENEKINFEVTY